MSEEVAAPQPIATQEPVVSTPAAPLTFEQAKALALGQAPDGAPETGEAPPLVEWDQHLPKPKVMSPQERIKARREQAALAAQQQDVEARIAQLQQQNQSLTVAQQQADVKFQQLVDSGDIDGALKVKGVSLDFAELQRRMLVKMGALNEQALTADPRVSELEARVKAFEAEKLKAQQQQAEMQRRQAAQAQMQEDIQAVKQELASLSLPQAAEFAEVAGASQAVLTIMMRDPNITSEQAAAIVHQDYRAFYEQLAKVYGPKGSQQLAQAPQQASQPSGVAQRLTARPLPAGGARPPQGIPPEVTGHERARLAKELALKGLL